MQGRKSRGRSADDIERLVRDNMAQGVNWFFMTDDNFARNKDWEVILDRLVALRQEFAATGQKDIKLIIQVDTLCHKIDGFIDKAKAAGVVRVFLGLESINPQNLAAAKKRQNKITEYRQMLLAWKRGRGADLCRLHPRLPERHAGEHRRGHRDHPEGTAARHSGVLLSDAAAGLGGPPDVCSRRASPMDADLNRYDIEHVVTAHPKMSRDDWQGAYLTAWDRPTTRAEHVERMLRRAAATGGGMSRLASMIFLFSSMVKIEKVHPLQGGILRLKRRTDRRPSAAAGVGVGCLSQARGRDARQAGPAMCGTGCGSTRCAARSASDPNRLITSTRAITPVHEHDTDELELFTHSQAAQDAVHMLARSNS